MQEEGGKGSSAIECVRRDGNATRGRQGKHTHHDNCPGTECVVGLLKRVQQLEEVLERLHKWIEVQGKYTENQLAERVK
jgi:hypothetical protein